MQCRSFGTKAGAELTEIGKKAHGFWKGCCSRILTVGRGLWGLVKRWPWRVLSGAYWGGVVLKRTVLSSFSEYADCERFRGTKVLSTIRRRNCNFWSAFFPASSCLDVNF